VFQGVDDQGISNRHAQDGENDPGFHAVRTAKQKNQGRDREDRDPKTAIGQKVEELVKNRVVEAPVDPTENSEVQRINLGDQVSEAKL